MVELLVAMTIAAIVSGSIASLLIFSLRMYGKQTVDVEMQQEIQMASNVVIDSIMESDSFIVSKSNDSLTQERTDVAILGRFDYTSQLFFTGYVFCVDNVDSSTKDGKLYMKKYTSESLPSDCENTGKIVPNKVVDYLSNGVAGQNANLLATNLQIFNLTPSADSIVSDKYNNPFSVTFDIKFAKSGGSSDVKKELHDAIAIRNTLKAIHKTTTAEMTPVCIKDTAGTWTEYYQPNLISKKDSDELKIVTETVKMEERLGYIETPGGDGSFNILEIVPDYSCDYVQYSIGGKNGECFDYANITYGDSNFDRVTPDQLMNYINTHYNQHNAPYFYQNGSELKTLVPVFDYSSWKYRLINNDLFKLFLLKDSIETASGKTINPYKGMWDEAAGKYYEPNYSALKKWEENHTLTVNVCIPKDLDAHTDYIDNADMIIIATPADEGFKTATTWYNNVKGTSRSASTLAGGDISFDNVLAIYNKVVNNQASIACPSALDGNQEATDHPNLNALFKMLYRVKDKAVYGADDGTYNYTYNSNISNGSGRDAFRTVTSFGQVDEYFTILQEQKYNSKYVTPDGFDFLYAYDYTGAAYPSIYKNQLIYNNESTLLTFVSSGQKGLLGLSKANTGATNKIPKASHETFGEVELVGISLHEDKGRHVPNYWPWGDYSQELPVYGTEHSPLKTYSEVNPIYEIDVVKLNNPVVKTIDGEEVSIDKVIYLNDYEYEYAKTHDAWVFCLVNSTAELSSEINLKVNGTIVPSPLHNPMIDELVSKYRVEPGKKIKEKDVIRTMECRCSMNIVSESGATIGNFDKYIKVKAEMNIDGKAAMGTDYAFVVVRDLFDLD